MDISYAPRPEYGLVVPLLASVDGGVTARGGAEWLVLTAPLTLELDPGHRPRAAQSGGGPDGSSGPTPLDAGADAGTRLVGVRACSDRRCHGGGLAIVVRPAPGVRRAVA